LSLTTRVCNSLFSETTVAAQLNRYMTEIKPRLLLAGYREAGKDGDILAWYRRLKVDHVLCVASEFVPPTADGLSVKHIPLDDDNPREDITRVLVPAVAYVEKSLSTGGTILVHCRDGASRAVCVILAVLIKHYDYSLIDAYHYVSHRRKQVNIFPQYLDQLQRWAQ